ncbi:MULTISPECIES: magnesium-translocating P-type ATPase [Lactobacillus]|uniref:Magnesium-transporting ATPase, P-type 1 n=1 Tax=Lactobacillus xujianguonis TaxID=2495899 RepID=A0A437SU25_9LACO|nr:MULTISPECIES: magnesium-translocating P-type ATPase [Lactobacillus]RVU70362.1 magnesium-translocating P-type ATPase [Lactobacillus xujianguonis]RVU73098.1 magnesium-translocating P-type ATPase [Lactobacillus xujianguonis]RVU73709.1 magnesium-translocating P-type ATPase [Lactobacillus xujianguonis]
MLNVKMARKGKNPDLQLVKRIARETRVETLARLHASAEGLSTRQANINREEYGANEVNTKKNDSKWHFFIEAFLTPFTIVLFGLAVILFVTDVIPSSQANISTAIIVLAMVIIAGIIKFVQNLKASDAVDNMLQMVSVTTNVKRDNEDQELPTNQVVVGDVINLAAGDMVPADMRLLRSKDLFCSTSAINGDFNPVEKIATKIPCFDQVDNYLNYPNILYEGTTIVSGSGAGVVFATGEHTAFGHEIRIANRKQIRRNTFSIGIKSITKLLMTLTVVVGSLTFLLNGLTKQDWLGSLVFAMAVAVGLTPEMLPAIVTSNLVKGSSEMAKGGAVIKKMASIQSMGSTDVLCTEKTGFLTQDRVMLERHYDLAMHETNRVLKLAYLNAYYQTGMKDLIDEAVIEAAGDELDVDDIQRDYNKIDEIPFDYNRRRMSVVVANSDENHGEHLLLTKGAAEEVLAVSTKMELNGQVLPLTPERKAQVLAQVESLNDDGLRVLLLAYRRHPAPVGEFSVEDENDLTVVGFLTFLDPPKESSRATLAKLQRDGIAVKILTGDNEAVTRTLGLQVGLNVDTVYSAEDFEGKSTEEMAQMVEESNIFVELTPELKTQIIRLLKRNGHVISYVGDRINDDPAMRLADVAVSVDSAVDSAKETANVILLHKDLALYEEAVRVSRNVYGNIVKYFKVILTSSFGNSLSILIGSLLLPFMPMMSLQLVLLNLIYSLSCLVIPFDKMPNNYLQTPRTWGLSRLPKFMFTFGPVSTVIDLLNFGLLFFFICPFVAGGSYQSLSASGQMLFATTFYTGWFIESLWVQELIIHNIRERRFPFIRQHAAWIVIATTFAAGVIGTVIPFSGIAKILNFGPIPSSYLWYVLLLMVLDILLMAIVKKLYLRKEKFLI